jgi:hypothetical protein
VASESVGQYDRCIRPLETHGGFEIHALSEHLQMSLSPVETTFGLTLTDLPRQAGPDMLPDPIPRPRQERSDRTAELLERACTTACPDERECLLEAVVVLNMGVARAVARRFRNKGVPHEDLEQVAFLALTRAARNFDQSLRHDFLSYAVPTIRGELKKHFRDHPGVSRSSRAGS